MGKILSLFSLNFVFQQFCDIRRKIVPLWYLQNTVDAKSEAIRNRP